MTHTKCRSSRAVLSLAMASMIACTGDARDTADAAVPQRSLEVDLVIGTADGADAYVFGDPAGVAMDDAGRIYVADGQANEIRVFDERGTHVYTIGREGAGPGELRRPCCLAFDSERRLWVRDMENARYNAYRVGPGATEYVAQIRMAHADARYGAALTFDADGHLVDVGHRFDAADARRLYRHHLGMPAGLRQARAADEAAATDTAGTVIRAQAIDVPGPEALGAHIVEFRTPQGSGRSYIYPPYGPSHFVAHAPGGGWAMAMSAPYEVTWFDDAGDTIVVISRPAVVGPEVSAAERTRAEERLAEQLTGVGASPGDARFRVPDRKQPIGTLFFDQAGRLWVQRTVAEGADPRADVYAADGAHVMHVTWPRGISLSRGWVAEDAALGFTQDELGTPQVVRLVFGGVANGVAGTWARLTALAR